jgi:hypothetical protein
MADVFDASTKTPLRMKVPITDDKLPPSGALNWGSIASESALSTHNGCGLHEGDRRSMEADGCLVDRELHARQEDRCQLS